MSPFDRQFPNCANAERLVLHLTDTAPPLPPGDYSFFEWYCEDPACDCRRALLQVGSPQYPGRILATINFGWESEAFYTERMHGDAEAGREIVSASLDPLNPQSELAEALLAKFREHVEFQIKLLFPATPASLRNVKGTQTTISPVPSPGEIIRQLQFVPDKCDFAPYEAALRAAALQREAVTPELIAALERATADPAHYLKASRRRLPSPLVRHLPAGSILRAQGAGLFSPLLFPAR